VARVEHKSASIQPQSVGWLQTTPGKKRWVLSGYNRTAGILTHRAGRGTLLAYTVVTVTW